MIGNRNIRRAKKVKCFVHCRESMTMKELVVSLDAEPVSCGFSVI